MEVILTAAERVHLPTAMLTGTAANVADMVETHELLHDEEKTATWTQATPE